MYSPKLPAPLSQRNIIIKTNFLQRQGHCTSLSRNETQGKKRHRQSLPCKADDLVASGQQRQQAALCLFPVNLTSATNIKPTDTPTSSQHQAPILFFASFLRLLTKLIRTTGKSSSKGYCSSRTHFEQGAPCGQHYDGEGENCTYGALPHSSSPSETSTSTIVSHISSNNNQETEPPSPKPGTSARDFRALFP